MTGTVVADLQDLIGNQLTEETQRLEATGEFLSNADERQLTRRLLADHFDALAKTAYSTSLKPLTGTQEAQVTTEVMDRIHGLGRIQPLLDDPTISNIFINGCDSVFVTYTNGTKRQVDAVADSDDDLKKTIVKAAARLGRAEKQWDDLTVSLDLQLPGGDRLHAVRGVTGRPTVSIRRHNWELNNLNNLLDLGLIDRALQEFLVAAVKARLNLVIAGGTNTGKTTLLRSLINEIDPQERLITIEDNLELGIERFPEHHPNLVSYEARPPNIEGVGEVTMADCLKQALRQSPDRVIVGEVRGIEVMDMLQAMSQGNDGSMCSIHSNSATGALVRLAQYASTAGLDQSTANLWIANSVDLIAHIGWVGGVRRITSVIEVLDANGLIINSNKVFTTAADGRAVPNIGSSVVSPQRMKRLEEAGFDRTVLNKGRGWWTT